MIRLIFILCMLNCSIISFACPTVTLSAIDVSCNGGFDGQVQIVVTGTNGPFNITWTLGTLTGNFNNVPNGAVTNQGALPAGVFQAYVVDQLGCTSIQVITVYEPDPITGNVAVNDVDCFGDLSGDINLTVTGGTAPYTFDWSDNSVNQNNLNVAAGNYSVIVTDANNCVSSSIPATVNQPAQPVQTVYAFDNVSCAFGGDGAVDLSVWGGTAPYTFSWNGGTYVTEDISGLVAGNYTVVVTDYLGCVHTDNVLISDPTQLTSTIAGTDALCFGSSDGSINLSPTGGTAPYSYTWTSSSFTLGNVEDLTNIPADNYTVTIEDANGCTATNAITIGQPTPLVLNLTKTDVSCYGGSDGVVDLQVNGGTPLYSFDWSHSSGSIAITEDLINYPAEIYSVIVTDNNGCTETIGVELTEPATPVEVTFDVVDVACFGDNTGEIDLTVSGGTPGYFFNWSNGGITEDLVNLLANTYSVIVADANGCIENLVIPVNQPAAPLSAVEIITDVSCYDGTDGVIDLTVLGGTTPYNYDWVNSDFSLSVNSEDLIGFPADDYTLTVTDANNCTLTDVYQIDQPAELTGTFQVTEVLCHGDSTGEIDLEPNGGVQPYNFVWSNSAITEDLIHIPAGMYSVEVTDQQNCVFIDSVEVIEPVLPLSSYYSTSEPLCPGGADGHILFNVNGGTYPYQYFWSNFDVTDNIYDLTAGTYYVTVTDDHGCVLLDSAILDEPDEILIQASITDVPCYGLETGAIDLTVSGGTVPYTYAWANSQYVLSVTYPDLLNYAAEEYTVSVTDDHGCIKEETFTIDQPDTLIVTPYVTNISCADSADGSILLNVTGGTPFYNYSWNVTGNTQEIDNLGPGIYYYDVVDQQGCQASDTFQLTEPQLITFNARVSPVSCRDLVDGEIEIFADGGYGQYQYLWSNGTTFNPAVDLNGGFHSLTIVDLVGCTRDTTIFVPSKDVACLNIPNAITPNGDGINDDWVIENIGLYEDVVVLVYNKWGNVIFESKGYETRWDGTFNGKELPPATYYYIIEIGEAGEPFNGPITIVR